MNGLTQFPTSLVYFGAGVQVGVRGAGGDPYVAWQMSTDQVNYGGVAQASWSGTNSLAGGFTLIYLKRAIRQDGVLNRAVLNIKSTNGTDLCKIKVFRYNGSTYDFVGESAGFTVSVGANTIDFTGIPVQMGDIPAFYSPSAATELYTMAVSGGTRFAAGDITAQNAFSSTHNTSGQIQFFGTRPYLAVTGDSIMAGSGNGAVPWWPSFEDDSKTFKPGGAPTSEPANQIRVRKPTLQYQNLAYGGQLYTWGVSTGVPAALAVNPAVLVVHFGTNDITAGSVSEAYLTARLDGIKALVDAKTPKPRLMVCDIIPRTGFSDSNAAAVRAMNGYKDTWCAANGATSIITHDALGKIRASTGEYDDLADTFNQGDNVHLSEAGADKLGELIANYL